MGRRKREPKDDIPKIGHNSAHLTDDDRRKLRSYVGEVERIGEQIDELKAEQKLIYDSAKDSNFDVKAMRALVRERKQDKAKREAFEAVCDAYRLALGMLQGTPLGEAAMQRDGIPPTAEFKAPNTSDRPFAPPPEAMPEAPAAPAG